ncbi:MAG: HNH endonuclease [Planctomycetaceae bacterium]|nr:HNH endonuclease [Planctomycetaceae bacterium]
MKVRSLYDDERIKMKVPQACCYCGSTSNLSIDHLMPRISNGNDESSNLIWACRSCNSSKQGRDMLDWMKRKDRFPAVLLLRRYLKLVLRYCDELDLLELPLPEAMDRELPFELSLIPHSFPPLAELCLWIYPENSSTCQGNSGDTERIRLR